tara:strand:- start:277 stop:507 length:231 start_codon:yes stop_codon:yes gene_type:complete
MTTNNITNTTTSSLDPESLEPFEEFNLDNIFVEVYDELMEALTILKPCFGVLHMFIVAASLLIILEELNFIILLIY